MGKGRAYYLATKLDAAGLEKVYGQVAALSGDYGGRQVPRGVERVIRSSDGEVLEFLVNHSAEQKAVNVAGGGFELISDRELNGPVVLPPMGVAIVRSSRPLPS